MNQQESKRVVFCRSNPIAPDPRVEKAAMVLADAGYRVQLLGWDRSGDLPTIDRLGALSYERLPIRANYGTGLGNLPGLIRWQAGLMYWLIRNRRDIDLIHACDFDTVLPALISNWLFGVQVVYDIFDFYADHLRATPSWLKNLIRALDLWVIDRVDAVILTDEARFEQIGKKASERFVVINNTPQDITENFENQDHAQTWYQLRLVYVGLLQIERGLLKVIKIIKKHPEWHLDLAGFGGDQELILDMIASLPNVAWHGRIPYERALTLTATADVVLALYDPELTNHRYASPNKLFEAMMLAKPVIVAKKTNIDKTVGEENCGLVVKYGDMFDLEGAMMKLSSDEDLYCRLGNNGRRAYDRQYNWNKMADRLLELYTQLS